MMLSNPAKVGLITITALLVLGSVILWKTDLLMLAKGYPMIGSFEDVEGLTVGSEVRYRGLKIGKITKIDPAVSEINVFSLIDGNIKFPEDSLLRVAYDGIVGQKYLEIKPGTSEVAYAAPRVIYGIKTSSIVDFVDIGAKNLIESKQILEDIRNMIEDPRMQQAIFGTAVTANNVVIEAEKLTMELRETNKGIRDIVADPKFQSNVKGTIKETEKTLSAANRFFDSVGNLNVRATVGVDFGTKANAVIGNVDVVQSNSNYFRLGIGEGPTRQVSLLDILFSSKMSDNFGVRLGTISNQIGGGVAFYPSKQTTFRGDIYDINNEDSTGPTVTRLWPKVRVGYEYEFENYMDLNLKGDDLLNQGYRNITVGIMVKPSGSRIY
jgi:hypothetical protein